MASLGLRFFICNMPTIYALQRHKNRLAPHTYVSRIRRVISTAEVPTEEKGFPTPNQAPQPRAPVSERGVPTHLPVKIGRDSVQLRQRATADPSIFS